MKSAREIPDGATVLIDTSPIIYLLEGQALAKVFEPLFADVDAGRLQAMITLITLVEVMTGPLEAANDALAERYRHALTANRGWTLRDIDADIAVAAEVRQAR